MAQIKLMAPSSVRVAGRTVAREDYEINARRVPGIARAFMATSNEIPMIENIGQLYVVPAGGGAPSTAKKQEVLDMVTMSQEDFVAAYGYDGGYPHTLTFHVDVLDPVYLTVDVQTTVYLRKGYGAAAAKAAIEAALDAFFAITLDDGSPNPNVDFGWNVKDADGNPALEIAWSDVFNVVRDIPAVRKVDESATGLLLNGDRSDVPVGANRFPILGSVTVYDGDTGGLL
jgi:hypothetical protein